VIGKEGSLKLKELTYKHCQAYSMDNCSNGYFNYAMVSKDTPTFVIILEDEHKEKTIQCLEYLHTKT
jgi:glucosamine 6-phosphate synthetase-like amidotransferase/phosphosugar isomerase protein